ncbi:MAG: hypothetical protein QHH30_01465 [candidate division NC10 bacterium]|nr:hypothetical protein [candidate division NC10 bacterium]
MARKRFGVALLLFGLCSFLCPGRLAWSGNPHASTTLRLTAVVKPKVKLMVLHQTSQITPTPQDLHQGCLEIPNAAQLLVSTNLKEGLSALAQVWESLQGSNGHSLPISALSFSLNGGAFRPFAAGEQVIYAGFGQEVCRLKRLDYRLNLDRQAQPDTYRVNITFTVIGH